MSKELADVLFEKARQDLNAARLMVDVDRVIIGDAVFAFHIQQAIEKGLKAVLSFEGKKYPLHHHLDKLFTMVGRQAVPEKFFMMEDLSVYAGQKRYEDVVPIDLNLERQSYVDLAEQFLAWVAGEIRSE